jgi:hypothetical protein
MDIEKRHNHFYVPAFSIRVGKKQEDLLQHNVEIFSVTVNSTLKGADDFSFTVNNPIDPGADDFRYLKNQLFSVEQTNDVTITMGYGDRSALQTVFSGIMTEVDLSFPANGVSQLTVKGFDRSHKMMKSQHSDSWGSDTNPVKYSDVVKKIADKPQYGFGKSQIVDTREKHRQIKQNRQSDFDFMQKKLADEIGFEVFVRGNDLYFRPRANDSSDTVAELVWGRTLLSFSPKINTAKQTSEVQVRGWDSSRQKAIVGKARPGDEHGRERGRKSGGEAVAATQGDVVKHIWKPVSTQKEADALAKSVLEKTALGYVTGSAESLGIPEIMPGKNIQLSGLGKKFSKIYYIEKVTHTISTSGYKTTFDVTENSL